MVGSLKASIRNGRLRRARQWPDEFSWKGGFYLTPDKDSAISFGKAYRKLECDQGLGGLVILEFKFRLNTLGLQIRELGDNTPDSNKFHRNQRVLGLQVQKIPGNESLRVHEIRNFGRFCTDPRRLELESLDIVSGSVLLTDDVKDFAITRGEEPPADPFRQVVVVSPAGLRALALTKIEQEDGTEIVIEGPELE